MTKVKVVKKGSIISYIEVKGHAFSNVSSHSGKDVVCAEISAVVFGICNSLEELTKYDESQIIFKEGLIAFPDLIDDDKVQLICETLITQLKTIEKSYPKYIEISIVQEV